MKLTDEHVHELISTLRVRCADQGLWAVGVDVDDACDVIERLIQERNDARALLASFDEERLEEIITDSIDLDWTPRTAARAIVRAMKGASDE
jgi:hypothetical protein